MQSKNVFKKSKVRTSENQPISVSWILCQDDFYMDSECELLLSQLNWGRLGLCYCPGKKFARNNWVFDRNLSKDLTRLHDVHRAQIIVCLLGDYELRSLGVWNYDKQVQKAGMQLIKFPIIEMLAPISEEQTLVVIDNIIEHLKDGESVVMHCKGGVGRAGTIAACILLRLKLVSNAQDAIKLVRSRRCNFAIESQCQERFICQFATFFK
eukprot:TRINITY_DN5125_c0_g1_i1.p2 TRINITY_DN5125_c0_g1~~TRINITY_DN5125_c0_g1_i1.p2  ORF type:complete len:210 (+),score=21.57 TRINITY_DN5125_c0_g1_i1:158-787(+)